VKTWIIKGEPASKANSRQFIRPGLIIKSAKALSYEQAFLAQCRAIWTPEDCIHSGEVVLTATIYYASQRPDLDESLIMDCIEKAGLLRNDRQIREKHIYHVIDKQRPRVEFTIEPRGNHV